MRRIVNGGFKIYPGQKLKSRYGRIIATGKPSTHPNMLSQHKDEQIAVAGMRLNIAKQEHIDAADDLHRAACVLMRYRAQPDQTVWPNLENAANRYNARRQAMTLAELEYSRSGEMKA